MQKAIVVTRDLGCGVVVIAVTKFCRSCDHWEGEIMLSAPPGVPVASFSRTFDKHTEREEILASMNSKADEMVVGFELFEGKETVRFLGKVLGFSDMLQPEALQKSIEEKVALLEVLAEAGEDGGLN